MGGRERNSCSELHGRRRDVAAPRDRTGTWSRAFRGALAGACLALALVAGPPPAAASDRAQMQGLDEQVQEIKSDVLAIAAELGQLEEKLLYPSGTQTAVFVALAPGDTSRLDAVRVQIDGRLVAHYIYSFKELDALRRGGAQRLYVGNVATGEHRLEVQVDGKSSDGTDFTRAEQFTFDKDVGPKMLGLTVAGPDTGHAQVTLGHW